MTDETNPKDLIGAKKVKRSLIPASAQIHESRAFENGADKYGAYNWRRKKVRASIYVDATIRHLIDAWFDSREEVAEDSGVHHLGHARACLAILIDAMETGNLIDDRPPMGKGAELIRRFDKSKNKDSTIAIKMTPGKYYVEGTIPPITLKEFEALHSRESVLTNCENCMPGDINDNPKS